MSIDIWTPRGHKVIYVGDPNPKPPYPNLVLGQTYTVKWVKVYTWSSELYLEEVPGDFNGLWFDNFEGYDPSNAESVALQLEWRLCPSRARRSGRFRSSKQLG